jgi:hypothetical protein
MARTTGDVDVDALTVKLSQLHAAVARGLPRNRCLRRWSEFVRERDGHRCVDCHSHQHLSAHHICRKSFIPGAQFQTGNGITLCSTCHREMHRGFNGRPDLSLPVDGQGGEKLALMERLYSILTDDAIERGLMREEFYFLSDDLLRLFKRMQGYVADTDLPGSRIEQAYLILAGPELKTRRALLEAEGIACPEKPLLPGGLFLVLGDNSETPRKSFVVQTYVPRSKSDR